jgi:ribosomal-protein-alanine N-acetyltransferase
MLGDEWEIENIAVAQSSQRRGLGSALLQRLLEEARTEKAQSILLEVRESNLVARTFYEKFFFSEYGRRAGYYHNPSESAILYRLCL